MLTGARNAVLGLFGLVASVFCLLFLAIGLLLLKKRYNKLKRNEIILSESLGLTLGRDLSLNSSPKENKSKKKENMSRSGSSSDSGTYVDSNNHENQNSRHLNSPECMYQSAESNESNATHKSQGIIEFKATYDNIEKMLQVIIVKCSEIPLSDNLSDVYVKLNLLPEKRNTVKTYLQKISDGLKFDQKFQFRNTNLNKLKATSLHFVVIYFDKYSREHVIGEALYAFDSVQLSLQNELSVVKDLTSRDLVYKTDSTGELLISICHQPVSNRLTVIILKAANLPRMGISSISGDPFVRICIFGNAKCLGKQKTRIKKRTCNPIFNEAFVFDIPAGLDLKNVYLEMLVIDNDRMTKSEILGSVDIGINKSLSGELHWKEVLDTPRNQISHWHKLC